MNYALTSVRRVGDYYQKIITTYYGAPRAVSNETLNMLKSWHELINGVNHNHGEETGEIKYLSFTENDSGGIVNNGETASGTFVALSLRDGIPKTTIYKVPIFTFNTAIARIYDRFNILTYTHLDDWKNYLISATIDLH